MYGGTPWDVPENYLKNSALHHADAADTPTLFLMGNYELGGADKYYTVFQLPHKLKNKSVDTQYIYYPDEGHTLENPINKKDALEHVIDWIDDHFNKIY